MSLFEALYNFFKIRIPPKTNRLRNTAEPVPRVRLLLSGKIVCPTQWDQLRIYSSLIGRLSLNNPQCQLLAFYQTCLAKFTSNFAKHEIKIWAKFLQCSKKYIFLVIKRPKIIYFWDTSFMKSTQIMIIFHLRQRKFCIPDFLKAQQ